MTQEYKNNPLSLTHLIAYGGVAAIQLGVVYRLVLDYNKTPFWVAICPLIMAIVIGGFFQYLAWQSGKTTVVTTEDRLILRQFHKTLEGRWDEIQSIRRLFTIYAGYSYLVNTKKGITLGIPDTIKNCDELLAIIQERSGKRIISEWRGAKDSLREEWRAFLGWLRTHPLELVVILVIIGVVTYAATQWAIKEYRTYRPQATQQ